ncbi:hypothetical protein [Streptomyces gardneri]|uniref:hypothetical protein n=1 Tax=Streptomyces gardneri TaxID=66892 RepID=UPI0035DF4C1F
MTAAQQSAFLLHAAGALQGSPPVTTDNTTKTSVAVSGRLWKKRPMELRKRGSGPPPGLLPALLARFAIPVLRARHGLSLVTLIAIVIFSVTPRRFEAFCRVGRPDLLALRP